MERNHCVWQSFTPTDQFSTQITLLAAARPGLFAFWLRGLATLVQRPDRHTGAVDFHWHAAMAGAISARKVQDSYLV